MLRQGISLCALLLIAACMKKAAELPAPTTDSSPSSAYAPSDTMHQTGADTTSDTYAGAAEPQTDAIPDSEYPAAADEPDDSGAIPESDSDSAAMPEPDSTWDSFSISSAAVSDTQGTLTVDAALADRGTRIWKSKQCAGCHELGRDQSTGPNLIGVTDRRTVDWLERWLQDPVLMTKLDETAIALKRQYNSQMPKLGLSQDDADALINYLAQETQRHAK